MTAELPEDLSEDMEVLFIKPYSQEDMELLRRSGNADAEMIAIFNKANAADPNFEKFEDTIGVIKTMLGLGGYVIGDDLILLHGDKKTLLEAQKAAIDNGYTCFFDTVGALLKFEQSDEALVIKEKQPRLN